MHGISTAGFLFILPSLVGLSNPMYTWLMLAFAGLIGMGIGQYIERRKYK